MLAYLLAVAINQSPLDAPITLDNQPSRMDVVLNELGTQAGIKIKTTGAPLRDYVYVYFNKRSLRASLDLIAQASNASWREEGGEIIFSAPWPPNDKDSKAARAQMIQAWLDQNPPPPALTTTTGKELLEDALRLNKNAGAGNSWEQIQELDKRAPLGRLQTRLVHAIGAEKLAEIEVGETRFYSLNGNQRVHALPANARAMLADFQREANQYKELVLARGAQAEVEEQGFYVGSLYTYFHTDFDKIDSWFIKFDNQYGQVTMTFTGGSDEVGGTVLNGYTYIATMQGMMGEQPATEDAFTKYTDVFPMPEDWTQLPQGPDPNNPGTPQVSAAIRERLTNMDKDEILTDFADDPVRFIAKSQELDAVAIIPDAAFLIATMGRLGGQESGMTVGAILRSLYMFTGGEIIEGEKTFIVRPKDLTQARKNRVPREETAALIRKVLPTGEMDLDVSAELAAATEDDMSLMFALAMANLVLGESNMGMGDPQMLRFYGHFPISQRRKLKDGPFTVVYNSLKKEQKTILDKMFYSGSATLITREALEVNQENFYQDGGMQMHPAVRHPEGIPNNSPITLRINSKEMLYARAGQSGYSMPVQLEQLAWSKAYGEKTGEDHMSMYTAFAFAPQKKLIVEVALGDLFFQRSLEHGGPKPKQKFVPFEELPADALKEFNDLLKEKREQLKEMDIDPPTRRNPPPPMIEPEQM